MNRSLILCFLSFTTIALWGLGCDNSVERETSNDPSKQQVKLRSLYRDLSVKQIQSTPHIIIRKKMEWGFWGHSSLAHNYETKTVNGDKVIIDRVTGLIWLQSGSAETLTWSHAKEWLLDLNHRTYAGFSKWRLPTVDEAASLLESSKQDQSLYINAVFDKKQEWIWTGDSYDSRNSWSADFSGGGVLTCNVSDGSYVRPVFSDN
ncbi:MAG: DUF1566 domain-containing protein [Candidatus Scalindua sp. AMX11]|nr:MAG: DUF1566 domain-containing protein [Candidatus Scalindua sp.]NOG83533.1 DUF1566 domain-containing protein [Planctomycetota bacterium]RZV72063.1 MAG: DUF1566 domain-containing protein [Candidatus Scalindua sp. SCAELEC01]TDE64387.1 MAG: DUF1566 domain-containing protein [Candidatus Scalindua sp. AMX11]GJQ59865.1 MAG: hypothetical protein SCALA701_26660 [Candidatus Scalindua sp.]